MRYWPSAALSLTVLTAAAAGAWVAAGGGALFSPGPLRATSRTGQELCGVSSHAELASRCEACHAPPWSGEDMATRCLGCHSDVGRQLEARSGLHGRMPDGRSCRACHTEHRGAQAQITSFHRFDHSWTAFPLDGAHARTECAACHKGASYRGAPTACVACHQEPEVPKVHRASYGPGCASCHSTQSFKGASFSHPWFPMRHGHKKGDGEPRCATCHPNAASYKEYTCYGCHKHQPAKTERSHLRWGLTKIDHCAECHPRGKKRRAEAPRERLPDVCLAWGQGE